MRREAVLSSRIEGTRADISDWGLVFAASLISVAPILLLFIFLQKYFIKGMVTGAVKG